MADLDLSRLQKIERINGEEYIILTNAETRTENGRYPLSKLKEELVIQGSTEFNGIATPQTEAPTLDGYWVVTDAGKYPNFGGVELPTSSIGFIVKKGNDFTISHVGIDGDYFKKTDKIQNDNLTFGEVKEGDKNVVSGGDVYVDVKKLMQRKTDTAAIENVVKMPKNLDFDFVYGNYNYDTQELRPTINSLATSKVSVKKGDVISIKGYLELNFNFSGLYFILFDSVGRKYQRFPLTKTKQYTQEIPEGYDQIAVIIAYNNDPDLKDVVLDDYKKTFRMVYGTNFDAELILPELPEIKDIRYQPYHSFDEKTRRLASENKKMKPLVDSLRNKKTQVHGTKKVFITNYLNEDIKNAVAILQVHWGKNERMPIALNDVYLDEKCTKDFTDIRFSKNGKLLDSFKGGFGNYELITDNRLMQQMCDGYNGSVFGCRGYEEGIYRTETNYDNWRKISEKGYLTGANVLGDVFYYYNNKFYCRKKTEDFQTEHFILEAEKDLGNVIFDYSNWIIDDENNIFLGSYQGIWDARVYKSSDNGYSFKVVYNSKNNQHVHSLVKDDSVIPNVIYANLDGRVEDPDGIDRAKTVASYDRGNTWHILDHSFPTDFGVMYAKNGVRLSGLEAGMKPWPMVTRSVDNGPWETILDEQANCVSARVLNKDIYIPTAATFQHKFSQIFRSQDFGKTFDLIHDIGYRDATSTAIGWRYGSFYKLKPAEMEEHIAFYYGNKWNNKYAPFRLVEGGNHYQAMFYVKLPFLPKEGLEIDIEYGYLTEDVRGDVFNETNVGSEVYNMQLNEFGSKVSDSIGTVYNVKENEWEVGTDTERFGKVYPRIYPNKDLAAIALTDYIKLPSVVKLTKGFSFSFWGRMKKYDGNDRTKYYILKNDYLSIYLDYTHKLIFEYNGVIIGRNQVFSRHQESNYAFITVTVSNDVVPVVKCYVNAWQVSNELFKLEKYSPNATPVVLGGWGDNYFFTNFTFYNKELTLTEVISKYNGGVISNC